VTKKLVEKKTCPTDRRLVDISITDEGLQLLVRIDKKDRQIDDAVKNLSEEEAQQLNYLLDKIREKTK
jgi:DNA-binding MarR family transcriptional regulator